MSNFNPDAFKMKIWWFKNLSFQLLKNFSWLFFATTTSKAKKGTQIITLSRVKVLGVH